jgi:hypothetical protein
VLRRLLHERAPFALGVLVIASTALRYAGSTGYDAPWISPDEEIYALLGRSLWDTGSFEILDAPAPYYSALYPALVGLPLSLLEIGSALEVVKVLQAAVMSSAAIPIYLWGRSLVSQGWALAAAALTLALPAFAYTGLVMSETLFLPVSVTAVWALARALERPTVGRQVVFAVAVAAAVATRLQAIVLVAAFVLAVPVLAFLARDRDVIRRFLPALAGIGAVGIAWVVVSATRDGSWHGVLGAYATAGEQGYEVSEAVRFVFWHVADVFLLVLGAPLLALLALAVTTVGGRETEAPVRAFVAATTAYVALLTAEVGVFASRFVGHFAERQLVTAAPPLFLALVVWLHRGAPRPQPWTSVVAALVAAPVVLLPIRDFASRGTAPNALMTIPLDKLAGATSTDTLENAYLAGGVLLIVLFVVLPRRLAPLLGAVVAAGLIGASGIATAEVAHLSDRERLRVFGAAEPGWIDRATDGDVTLVWTEEDTWTGAWQQLFWNERIKRVVRPPEQSVPGPLPQGPFAPRFDGRLYKPDGTPLTLPLVAASGDIRFVGEPVTRLPTTPDLPEMLLWRPKQPTRVAQWTTGIRPNGDLVGIIRVTVYACGPGRLELTLLGKEGRPVGVYIDGKYVLQRMLAPGDVAHLSIPAPATADGQTRCVYELESNGLTGSTRIQFVRE